MSTQKNLLFLTSFIVILSMSASHSKADNIVSPEKVYDMAFSNCTELKATLQNQAGTTSAIDKLKLAENLSKIITLKTPSNSQFPTSSSAPYNPKTFDVSLTLNPNSENKAKECAINNLNILLPESIVSIPSLISASKDTSLPRFLKVLMLEEARSLAKSIKEPLKDYTLSALTNEFKTNKQIFNEELLIPTLLPLIPAHRDYFRSLALEYQSSPLMKAIKISNTKNEAEALTLIKELTSSSPSATKIFILREFSQYSEQVKELLEVLPDLVKNFTSTETNALIELISKLADSRLTYFPEYVSDQTGEALLNLTSIASEEKQKSLAKTAREINLNPRSKLCNEILINKEQSGLSQTQKIYLASLCSLKNASIENIKTLVKQKNIENITLSLVLISKSEPLRASYLGEAYKDLEKIKSSIAPKEFRNTGYYILNLENQNPASPQKAIFTKLAEELISEEPSYPSILEDIIIEHEHPSILYLTSLGKQSIKPVSKLLRSKRSAFLKKQGLEIFSSNSYVAYPELIPLIENLLADEDLDVRRYAYHILHRRTTEYPAPSRIKVTKNIYSQFYGARLKLQFLQKTSAKEREKAVLELFTSIPSLNCQEASVPLKYIEKADLLHLPTSIKENAENHFVQCLKDKSLFGKRSINTLDLLSPLSEKGKMALENLLINEKPPQLSAKDGISYLTLLYAPSFSSKLPEQLVKNLFTELNLKNQALYLDWFLTIPLDPKEKEQITNTYFEDTAKELTQEILRPENPQDQTNKESNEEIERLTNLLDKHGKELRPLIKRLSASTMKEIISYADTQNDSRLSLDTKSLLCPFLLFKDCNITIKPSLEYTLENPDNIIKEITIMLDRKIVDSKEDQLLLNSAIEYRLSYLMLQGNIQTLMTSKLPIQFLAILEKISSNSQDPALNTIAKFIQNSMAPID